MHIIPDHRRQSTRARWLAGVALASTLLSGCVVMQDSAPVGAIPGTVAGTVTGNVLGYVVARDGRTLSFLGSLSSFGAGQWQGVPADDRLRRAQSAALEIANLEARGRYPFEHPKLYASIAPTEPRRASFEKLEAHLPFDAILADAAETTIVLQRLGRFAGSEGLAVTIEAPTERAQRSMLRHLLEGVRGGEPAITQRLGQEPRVIVERPQS